MKKIIGILMLTVGIVSGSQAQKLTAGKVPVAVKTAFTKLHPATKASWEMEKNNYEAGFKLNGKKTSEVYTANGVLIETEVAIKSTELPVAVLSKLRGVKIAESAKITKSDDTIRYEAEVNGKDLLFDAAGNPVK
ncbi:hypothetical protein [Pedobacter cryoconitis]|uniref:Uncharacterized protein n=1 Tax=Pedobacter cryoconitis TaxID=188932 RepID=A0A7X0J504_9SPHI|nr:hypothetical protein [Pedobacter cryoconitis]MBB6501246.1 hypothetical protein [Pedobacter cryoconitis]